MDNQKTDTYYLQKIIVDLSFIIAHTDGLSQEQFEADEVLVDSVMFRLIQVSENSGKLTDDLKAQHASVPWHAMKGLRNRIVHEYGSVVLSIIYDTVQNDLPELLNGLRKIL